MLESLVLIAFLIAALAGLLYGAWWSTRLGRRQGAVAAVVKHTFPRRHKLMHHVTLPIRAGTTEIDHIIVADTGVFVIEAKHYSGWVFGRAGDAQWTQVLYRTHRRFQNPIRQNYGHIKAVQALSNFPDQHYISVVVFTGTAQLKTDMAPGVVRLAELGSFLNQPRPVVFTPEQMALIIGRIELARLDRSAEADEQHINNVRVRIGQRRKLK